VTGPLFVSFSLGYDQNRAGVVERDAPARNEHLFADLGDALCYAVGEMRPSQSMQRAADRPRKAVAGRRDMFSVNYATRSQCVAGPRPVEPIAPTSSTGPTALETERPG
jgi:hypothetical protein